MRAVRALLTLLPSVPKGGSQRKCSVFNGALMFSWFRRGGLRGKEKKDAPNSGRPKGASIHEGVTLTLGAPLKDPRRTNERDGK